MTIRSNLSTRESTIRSHVALELLLIQAKASRPLESVFMTGDVSHPKSPEPLNAYAHIPTDAIQPEYCGGSR